MSTTGLRSTNPSDSPATTPRSGPGRPRAEGHDRRIIEATLRLIDHERPVTVNAVVTESGVSRAALYRRWPSITTLVADALDHGRATPDLDITGDLKRGLLEMIFDRHKESRGTDYPDRRFRKRLELVLADQDLQWAYWESHVRRRRSRIITVLRTAKDRGELRADLDVEAALDALLGVFYYQVVVRGCSLSDPEALSRCRKAFENTWRGMAT